MPDTRCPGIDSNRTELEGPQCQGSLAGSDNRALYRERSFEHRALARLLGQRAWDNKTGSRIVSCLVQHGGSSTLRNKPHSIHLIICPHRLALGPPANLRHCPSLASRNIYGPTFLLAATKTPERYAIQHGIASTTPLAESPYVRPSVRIRMPVEIR
jgi:hypothetical protein